MILRIVGSKVNRLKLKFFVGNLKLFLEDYEFIIDVCLEDGDFEIFVIFIDLVILFWMFLGIFFEV